MRTYQLFTQQWFDAVEKIIAEVAKAHRSALAGVNFILSEQYLDAPGALKVDGDDPASTLIIEGGTVRTSREFRSDADIWVRADYETMRIVVRTKIPTDPDQAREESERLSAIMEKAVTAKSGEVSDPAVGAFLTHLHNEIASITD